MRQGRPELRVGEDDTERALQDIAAIGLARQQPPIDPPGGMPHVEAGIEQGEARPAGTGQRRERMSSCGVSCSTSGASLRAAVGVFCSKQ